MTTPKTDTPLTEWLAKKLAEAKKALSAREQMEKTWRSGTDASWDAAAKAHPSTADKPPMTKADRLKAAEGQKRIAAKCRIDVEMFTNLAALEQSNAELRKALEEVKAETQALFELLPVNARLPLIWQIRERVDALRAALRGKGAGMSARGWKLFDDGNSAVAAGTPFRVSYFLRQEERHLYFATKEEAFAWVQDNPTFEGPEIKDMQSNEYLYPKCPK